MAVNSIQMPVNIKLNQNEAMSSAYGKYYLEVATSEVLSFPNSWHRDSP